MKGRWLAGFIALVCLAGATLYGCAAPVGSTETVVVDSDSAAISDDDSAFARAFADKAVNRELEGQGIVSKLLADDTEGARHQRFIVTLDSGQTLLMAHNIDVAPRVSALRVGDTVSFKGEYEWNAQGGVMHWTHHDPSGSHATGWIRHDGRTYQ
ncbi:MAG: DUF3465 domain-containing protein [Thermoleophilia bacterium]